MIENGISYKFKFDVDNKLYPGEGNGYPLQYSCLENFIDRGAWRATVLGVTKRHN